MNIDEFGLLEKELLDGFQKEFPLEPRPFRAIAEKLGCDEDTVLDLLRQMRDGGLVIRVGPVFAPHRAGASTLAAMAVPPDRLEEVADLVSGYEEVNHNYEREHRYNLWFVLAAPNAERISQVLEEIAERTGMPVMDLPLQEAFHIDLGFPLQWN